VTWDSDDDAALLAGLGSVGPYPSGDISHLCGKGNVKLVVQFRIEFPAGEFCTISEAAFTAHTRKRAEVSWIRVHGR
jgi:hypothetical protein